MKGWVCSCLFCLCLCNYMEHAATADFPPTIEPTENITEFEGQYVRLQCIATGDPVPSIFWRRKGSQVDYLLQSDAGSSDIYVMEEDQTPEQDGDSVVYKRTAYLVITYLKPEHAGEYVCKADNQYGRKEKTFKIGVKFKPNFKDQTIREFFGWVGSTTNLTCIANGNPEPLIIWFRNGQAIEKGASGYKIENGVSGSWTRAISYLTPIVDSNTKANVFGQYQCEAKNRYDAISQTLDFTEAVAPAMPSVNVITSKATEMVLRISPNNNGGQPITKYEISYRPSYSGEDPKVQETDRHPDECSTLVTLTELMPNTRYSIGVSACNVVGKGEAWSFIESTKDVSVPNSVRVISEREGVLANEYSLIWEEPMTGGAPIAIYIVLYYKVLELDDSGSEWRAVRLDPDHTRKEVTQGTMITLDSLEEESYYRVEITAVNRIGTSEPAFFIFRTGRGNKGPPSQQCMCLSMGSILGIASGSLALGVSVTVIIIRIYVRRQKKRMSTQPSRAGQENSGIDNEYLEPVTATQDHRGPPMPMPRDVPVRMSALAKRDNSEIDHEYLEPIVDTPEYTEVIPNPYASLNMADVGRSSEYSYHPCNR